MRTLYWNETVSPGEAFHVVHPVMRNHTGIENHNHDDFAEFFWVDEGEAWHRFNGERYEIGRNDLLCIHPCDEHTFELKSGKTLEIYNIAYTAETLAHLQKCYKEAFGDFLAPGGRGHRLIHMDETQRKEVLTITHQLSRAPRQPIYIDRFLTNLLCIVAHSITDEVLYNVPDWLQRACRDIRNPDNFFHGSRAFVKLAGRCQEHVARELKKATGMTPTEYVNRVRLDYAAQTLELSEKAIFDIALECGFNSLGHFYQRFKKQFGMPPRLYRLRRRGVLPLSEK